MIQATLRLYQLKMIYQRLKIDIPNVVNVDTYKRAYLKMANASGEFLRYVEQGNASTDVWDQPSGVEGTDFGYVQQVANVWVSMEARGIGDKKTEIGQQETKTHYQAQAQKVNVPQLGKEWLIPNS